MSQISWTIVWIIVGLFLNSQCNKNICYEKRIDNYLFLRKQFLKRKLILREVLLWTMPDLLLCR